MTKLNKNKLIINLNSNINNIEELINEFEHKQNSESKLEVIYERFLSLKHKDIPAERCSEIKLMERIDETEELLNVIKKEILE